MIYKIIYKEIKPIPIYLYIPYIYIFFLPIFGQYWCSEGNL